MDDGYLLVQWRSDGTWFHGADTTGMPSWRDGKRGAMEFSSQKEFRDFERKTFGGRWYGCYLRFVRVRTVSK